MNSYDLSKYQPGGLERESVNILRLLSELEGSYQLLKYMGFEEDTKTLEEIKKRYYKIYFKQKRQEESLLE
jgi:hypothetical protein